VPRSCGYPHLEPICGYLGHPTHAKYRSVRTTWPHTWLQLCHHRFSQPGLGAHHGRLCLQFRVYREGASSCTVQAAFVNRHHTPPDAVTSPLPPRPSLSAPLHSKVALCLLYPISIDRRPVIWSAGAFPKGVRGDGAGGGGQLEGVARTEVAAVRLR